MKLKSRFGGEYEVRLETNRYRNNRIYLGLNCYDEEYGFWEPYAAITVNIDADLSDKDCGFLDVNNFPEGKWFVENHGIGEPTGRIGFSGFCAYPEYRFNMNVIKRMV